MKAERIAIVKSKNSATMQEKIANDGMSIFETINYAKQKYREDHTVNMASAFLTKDISEVMALKNDINSKDKEIITLNNKIENKNNEITRCEEIITSLQSKVQSKNMEISKLGIKHEEKKRF